MFLKRYTKNSRKGNKGNLVMQFVILIIIAAMMIFVVTAFGAKIWEAFFPSADKATLKSFTTLHDLMQAKSLSNKDYDSTKINLYLKDDYKIVYFDAQKTLYECGSVAQTKLYVYKPDKCPKDKSCLCLYKDIPATDEKKKNDNVARCEEFSDDFTNNVNLEDYELVDIKDNACQFYPEKQFQSLIVSAETLESNGVKTKTMHIWLNNAENSAKDAELSRPLCTNDGTICKGFRDGDIMGPPRDSTGAINYADAYIGNIKYAEVNAECRKTDPSSTAYQAKCVYDVASKACYLDCANNNVDCSQITSCKDYNSYGDGTGIQYTTKSNVAYSMCVGDPCNINKGEKCITEDSSHYACVKSNSKTGEALGSPDTDCVFPACDTRFMDVTGLNNFVSSYNPSTCNSDEQKAIDAYFRKNDAMYVCKNDYSSDECNAELDSINKIIGNCNFKKIQDIGGNIITGSKSNDCEDRLKTKYEPAYFCNDPNYNYDVVSIGLDPSMLNGVCTAYAYPGSTVRAYNCKKQALKFNIEVSNTGDYDITLSGHPKISSGGVDLSDKILSLDLSIKKGQSQNQVLTATLDITGSTYPEYDIYPGAHCTDNVCKSKGIGYKYMTASVNDEIIITPINP
jgi:hypothetical protein